MIVNKLDNAQLVADCKIPNLVQAWLQERRTTRSKVLNKATGTGVLGTGAS